MPKLSIVLVTWNVRDRVLACLESIHADDSRPDTEIIVVDNASGDDTVEQVAARFPNARVIANRENVGFPRANNQALAVARGDLILYLNPDTEVEPGTLARCVREMDADPSIGLVGCQLVHPDGRIQYEGARVTYHFRHLTFELLYLHMLLPRSRVFAEHVMGHWDHATTRDVEAISGAFMLTRRSLAQQLGGLPEDVFMYHEDLSFCLRVLRKGLRIRYVADVATVHHCGQSSGRSSARFGLLEAESKIRYIDEADGPVWAAAARGVIALRSLIRLVICVVGAPVSSRLSRRYPRVFDWRLHLLQLYWCAMPKRALRHAPGGEQWAMPGIMRAETSR